MELRDHLLRPFLYLWGGAHSYDYLRKLTQYKINKIFEKEIAITSRAINALSCYRVPKHPIYEGSENDKWLRYTESEVLQKLIHISPLVANHLFRCGLSKDEFRFSSEFYDPGYPSLGLFDQIFKNPSLKEIVRKTGELDEFTLFLGVADYRQPANPIPEKYWDVEKIYQAPVYDPSFRRESKNVELLIDVNDKRHLSVKEFGAFGKLVDGNAIRNDFNRMIRGNFVAPDGGASIKESSIKEFELLLSSSAGKESDIQHFFENNPEFLAGGDYISIRPHLILQPEEIGNRIPDFFAEPLDTYYGDLIEIKKPDCKLITMRANGSRVRFTQQVRDSISQLLEYRRIIEQAGVRKKLLNRYGVRGYRPKMLLVIGRDWGLRNVDNLQSLEEELPNGLEMLTYDAILERAKMYHAIKKYS